MVALAVSPGAGRGSFPGGSHHRHWRGQGLALPAVQGVDGAGLPVPLGEAFGASVDFSRPLFSTCLHLWVAETRTGAEDQAPRAGLGPREAECPSVEGDPRVASPLRAACWPVFHLGAHVLVCSSDGGLSASTPGLIAIKEAHDIETRLNEVEKLLKAIISMPRKVGVRAGGQGAGWVTSRPGLTRWGSFSRPSSARRARWGCGRGAGQGTGWAGGWQAPSWRLRGRGGARSQGEGASLGSGSSSVFSPREEAEAGAHSLLESEGDVCETLAQTWPALLPRSPSCLPWAPSPPSSPSR